METKSKSTPLITYIHEISGQLRRQNIIESEHAYAKFWNRHPDPSNKSRPARFLFMQSFARSSSSETASGDLIDVDSVEDKSFLTSNPVSNPLVAEVTALTKGQVTITEEFAVTDSAPNKSTWSNLAQRIWAKALNILYSDRLIRLSIEGTPNEIITKKMISHKCANKFRHLFASLAFWNPTILSWLHATLMEHVSGQYLIAYHESMQLLRSKFPTLIDRFYLSPVHNDPIRSRNKGPIPDPIQNVLNNHKPKRIKNCPLFILVPNGPQSSSSSITPQRLKHWQLLFASLGKIITLSVNYRPTMRVKECLNEIMVGVRDKINECRTTFTEGRPIVLVGFGHSSLIATHVALDPTCKVTGIICLGFPLAGVNGFRGDLDDPLLDISVPILFVIGQNATLSSIDDVEDFRERITKTETGLVVVGGANDHLVVSQTKQRFTGITQVIVDRCISDEIYDFINFVMNPHFVPSENNYVSAAAKNLSKTSTPGSKGEKPAKSKSKSKTEKQLAKELGLTNNLIKKTGILPSDPNDSSVSNKDSELSTQSTVGVNTQVATDLTKPVTSKLPFGSETGTSPLVGSPATAAAGHIAGVGNSGTFLNEASKITANVSGEQIENASTSGKAKPKAKKSRPKAKKKEKEETKKLEENCELLLGKDGKLLNEITPSEIIKESKQTKDMKESKQSKDLKESKESKPPKDMKEGGKRKEAGLNTSMTCEPTSKIQPQVLSQDPLLPPPLLTAPTLLGSSISSAPMPTLSNLTTHSGVTPSPPPPLITAPAAIGDTTLGTPTSTSTTTTTTSTAIGIPSSSLYTSKRKKTSTIKYDPDGSQPIKKKREEPVMSVSSLELIEKTLDAVIARSMLECSPPSPSPSTESSVSTTITQSSPQQLTEKMFKETVPSISIISTPTSSLVSSSISLTPTTTSALVTGKTPSTLTKSSSSSISRSTSSTKAAATSKSTPGSTAPKLTPIKPGTLTSNSSSSSSITTPSTSTTTKTGTNANRDYVFSYEVSEVTTLPPSSSNTRTRTIRAPKQLDI